MSRPETPSSELAMDLPEGASPSPMKNPGARSSHFTDSAISIEPQTPAQSPKRNRSSQVSAPWGSPSSTRSTSLLSNRLTKLAAAAWAAEEEDRLEIHERQALQARLDAFEAELEGRTRGTEQTSSDIEYDTSASSDAEADSNSLHSLGWPKPEPYTLDLNPILAHLTTTTTALQTRLNESQHLNALTLTKLNAIAQRCFDQEAMLQELTQSMQSLRQENTQLEQSNAEIHAQVTKLQSQIAQKEVGMSAMTGAVAGLEGWVKSTNASPNTPRNHNHVPQDAKSHRRTAMRGKGRFRGRYYIDEDGNHTAALGGMDGSSDPKTMNVELQEGIMGWVRGFRDIEDGLGSFGHRDGSGGLNRDSPLMSKTEYRADGRGSLFADDDDDDFGEFQTVTDSTVVTASTP